MPVSKRWDSVDPIPTFSFLLSYLGEREMCPVMKADRNPGLVPGEGHVLTRDGWYYGGTLGFCWAILPGSGFSFFVLTSFVSPSSCYFGAVSFFGCGVLVPPPL